MARFVIVNLHPATTVGGAEEMLRALASFLRQHGTVTWWGSSYDFYSTLGVVYRILGSKTSVLREVAREQVECEIAPITYASLVPYSEAWKRLYQVLRDADAIYAKNEFVELAAIAFIGGRRALRKCVVGVHTPYRHNGRPGNVIQRVHDVLYTSRFYRQWLSEARAIHALTADIHEDIRYITGGNTSLALRLLRKVAIIPNGVEERRDPGVPPQSKNFVAVGRLTRQKGFDRLAPLLKLRPDLRLAVAGDGDQSEALRKLLGSATFLGAVSRETVYEVMSEASAILIPSRWETQCIVLLEAMSLGRIPIVSNLRLFEDLLPPELHWLIVDFEDVARVSQTIDRVTRIIEDPAAYVSIAGILRNWVRRNFVVHERMTQLAALLSEAMP